MCPVDEIFVDSSDARAEGAFLGDLDDTKACFSRHVNENGDYGFCESTLVTPTVNITFPSFYQIESIGEFLHSTIIYTANKVHSSTLFTNSQG